MLDMEMFDERVRDSIYVVLIELGLITDLCDVCDHRKREHWVDQHGYAICGPCKVGTHRWVPQDKLIT